jgi:general secretion pathway protein E
LCVLPAEWRIPLIEILEVDEAVRVAIREGRAEALASTAPHADTLHGHGLALIAQGRTSFAELERAVQAQ